MTTPIGWMEGTASGFALLHLTADGFSVAIIDLLDDEVQFISCD
jgi:hypothetical protein